jgi:hypothetical protein
VAEKQVSGGYWPELRALRQLHRGGGDGAGFCIRRFRQ